MTRILGIVLIVLGLAGLVVGGLSFERKKADVDLGPVDFEVTERKTVPVPPVAGAAAVVAGVALMLVAKRGGAPAR
jgi:hypothetical protein